jgi:hypothetical protein
VPQLIRLILVALLLSPTVAFAQSFSQLLTVNSPFDPSTYKPLDNGQRAHRWLMEDGAGPSLHVQSLASAAYLQFINDPPKWKSNIGGYARRAGSSYGSNLIENSVHESFAAVEGTDPRYFACRCKGFFPRSAHAIKMTFLTYTRSGHETLDIPQLAGVYGGSMIEYTWWPHHYSALVQGVQSGHIVVGIIGAEHIIQEFSPELKRIIHMRSEPAAVSK